MDGFVMKKYVAYYRVSTVKQGLSGLGLESQQLTVNEYVNKDCNGVIIKSFIEIESGKNKSRPELNKAIQVARQNKAVLLVAKIDRLARNVAFLANLMESGIEFLACDNPNATRLTIQILSAVAEEEARAISARTKAALAAAKAKGVKLGSSRQGHWEGREELRKLGQKKATIAALDRRRAFNSSVYGRVMEVIKHNRLAGVSYRKISILLNNENLIPDRSGSWNPMKVYRWYSNSINSNSCDIFKLAQ